MSHIKLYEQFIEEGKAYKSLADLAELLDKLPKGDKVSKKTLAALPKKIRRKVEKGEEVTDKDLKGLSSKDIKDIEAEMLSGKESPFQKKYGDKYF